MQNRITVRSLRTVNIISTTGHSAIIPAGVDTEIPMIIAPEAFAKGCIAVGLPEPTQIPPEVDAPVPTKSASAPTLDDDEDITVSATEAAAPEAPKTMRITEAFDALVKAGDKSAFRVGGQPRTAAVQALLGRAVLAQEVDAAWALYQQGM